MLMKTADCDVGFIPSANSTLHEIKEQIIKLMDSEVNKQISPLFCHGALFNVGIHASFITDYDACQHLNAVWPAKLII